MRKDIRTIRLVERGEPIYMYKVLETRQYFRVSEIQHRVLSLLDGTRTPLEVVEEFNAGNPVRHIDLDFLEEFFDDLRPSEIFEKSPDERRRLLLETIRDRRRRAANRSPLGSLFEISVSAWDPDRFFERLIPHIRFFWSRRFVAFSAACIIVMLGIWIAEWSLFRDRTLALFTFKGQTGADVLQLVIIILIVGFCHECAHGLTCKYFGGRVNRMGFLLIYFTPCFFADVSDAYLFDRHSKRQWVIYAGLYIELFICSLATFVWTLTSAGTLINDISFKVLLMTGASSILLNYNPLIKLDGYYSLMDYLEIPDLWERSSAYVSGWFKKRIFRLPVELETTTRKVRRILVAYGLASLAYRAFLIVLFLLFLQNVFAARLGPFGSVAFGAVLLLTLRGPLSRLGVLLKFSLLDKKEALMKTRSLIMAGAIALLLLAALAMLPFPTVIRGDFLLEPRSKTIVRSPGEGIVERVLVGEGQAVGRGETVALLRNDALSRRLSITRGRLEAVEQEIARAASAQRPAVMASKGRERDLLLEQAGALRERADALTLRSPVTGVVTTPRLADRAGAYLEPGQPFCEIVGPEGLLARVPIRERRLDEIRPGQRVTLKVASFPLRTFPGTVIAVAPAAHAAEGGSSGTASAEWNGGIEYTDFDAIVSVTGRPGDLREGMSGTARITIGHSTAARRTVRALRRWIGSRLW